MKKLIDRPVTMKKLTDMMLKAGLDPDNMPVKIWNSWVKDLHSGKATVDITFCDSCVCYPTPKQPFDYVSISIDAIYGTGSVFTPDLDT